MLLLKCTICSSKRPRFIKKQVANELLSSLGFKTPLSKYKMNEIVNKVFLVGDKIMPEMHSRQPGFMYSACGTFTKNKEKFKCLKKQEIQAIFTEKS